MTIRLLCAYSGYPANAIVTLDAATEAGLVAAKQAATDTTGGTPYVPPVAPNSEMVAKMVISPTGVVLGLRGPDGSIIALTGSAATAPGAPTSVTATAGDTTASVSWVAPANNGGSAITGYVVTDSATGTQYTATTSPLNLTGLANGTARTFSVVAVNSFGPSAAAVSNSVMPAVQNVFNGPATNEVGTGQYYTRRIAMRNSKRVALTVQNPSLTSSIDITTTTRLNNDYNPPGSGADPSPNIVVYAQTVPAGQQAVITADAGQVWARATAYPSTSLSASGTTVTAVFAGGHKLTATQIAAGQKIDFFFASPSAYNGSGLTPTYVDANTLTWTAATAPGGAGATQGYLAQTGLTCTVFEESTP